MPSYAVLSEQERVGLTQSSFLQEICISELQCGQTGRMLWRQSEIRNRTFSSLCNRTLPASTYEKYAKEIADQLSPRLIYNQARRFSSFLVRHEYNYKVLLTRLGMIIDNSTCYGENLEEIQAFFKQIIDDVAKLDNIENRRGFCAGFILAWLFIYAITDKAFMSLLAKVKNQYDIYALNAFLCRSGKDTDEKGVTYYGSLRTLAGGTTLPAHKYFGHEDELLDVRDAIFSGEKIWIHGIGGIGKTELVRQVIQQCSREHIVDNICMIQYTHNLSYSISRSFPHYDVNSSNEEGKITNDILAYLSEKLEHKGLLVIDNIDHIVNEDRIILKRLLNEQYAVVITSRLSKVMSFVDFPIRESNPGECLLIYRANLGTILSSEDKHLFLTMMESPVLCHPQTVYLLSKTAQSKKISLENIVKSLQDNASLSGGKCQFRSLMQMYRSLYSLHELSYNEKKLTDFFIYLPINSYSSDWIEKNFDAHGDDVVTLAKALSSAGILVESDGSFSMHPLVAKCLRKKTINEKRLHELFDKMANNHLLPWDEFAKVKNNVRYLEGHYWATCEVLFYLSDIILKYAHAGNLILALSQGYYVFDVSYADYSSIRQLLHQRIHESLDPVLADKLCLLLDARYLVVNENIDRYVDIAQDIIASGSRRSILDTCYLLYLGYGLIHAEYIDLSIEFLEKGTFQSPDTVLQLTGYGLLAERYYFSGQLQKCCNVVHKALSIIDTDKSINAIDRAITLSNCFNLLLAHKEYDELTKRIDDLLLITDSDELPVAIRIEQKMIALTVRSYLCTALGEAGEALQAQQKYGEYVARTVGTESYEYLEVLHSIAMIYRTMGEVDLAKDYFEMSMERFDKSTPVMTIILVLNNYAVLNLENGNTEKALELLQKALEVPVKGDHPLGEVYRNLGRVYDQLHQTEKAILWWQKAVPLLEKMYGSNHERVIYARNRINGKLEQT